MPDFKIVKADQIPNSDKWVDSSKFTSKDRVVNNKGQAVADNFEGRKYQLVSKKERKIGALARAGRISLGTLAVSSTFGLALLSKSVRKLFLKTEKVRFGVEITAKVPDPVKPEPAKVPDPAKPVAKDDLPPPVESAPAAKVEEIAHVRTNPLVDALREEFRAKALASPKTSSKTLDFTLSEETINTLKEANNRKTEQGYEQEGVKILRGGVNWVIMLDVAPGFVFKPMKSEQEAEEYVRLSDAALAIVNFNKLNLLKVSQSRCLEIDGKYFVMQEKEDLLASDYKSIKGIYTDSWENEEMKPYMTSLFTQLIRFINLSDFSDVKYDNIPLTKEGQVALFDLDNLSALTGLSTGRSGKNDGLFNYIPSEHLDPMMSVAKAHVESSFFDELNTMLPQFKANAEAIESDRNNHIAFHDRNKIMTPTQELEKVELFASDPKKQAFALFIIETLNQQLATSHNFSFTLARTLKVSTSRDQAIRDKAFEIWGKNLPITSTTGKENFRSLFEEVIDAMTKANLIYGFTINTNYDFAEIRA